MSNDDKLKVRPTESKKKAFKELTIIRDTIFWIDVVGEVQDENAIFVRPFNEKEAFPQKLTSKKYNIKNNFHGYGGKSYKCINIKNNFYLIWIDQITKAVWFQIFKEAASNYRSQNKYLDSVQEPRQLSKSIDGNFDSSFVISENNFLYGICEINNRDYLFSLNLKKTKQDIHRIKKFKNFAGELSSNTSANLLSWIEWDSPYMPWEKNDLFFAQIDLDGEIQKIKKFSNKLINAKKNVSFFQPYWISETLLVFSEDSSGWWNLLFLDVSEIENILIKKRVERNLIEYGAPQWVSGITFFSGTIKNLFCLAKKENNLIVEQYKDLELVKEFSTPFTSITNFSVFENKLAFKGYGSDFLGNLLEIDFAEEVSSNFSNEIYFEYIKDCSKPESFWFKGFEDKATHSLLYRPIVEKFRKPPLLVKAHSGPTSFFDGSYNSEVQYWTSKGFFVAEVNYGGSSGFGKEYRERLNYKWGIVDSYDCKALALELIKLNLVDSDKVVIFGNSAGGLTALNCLLYGSIFAAAICKYPVIDLEDMHYNTHRFEKDYLNSLVGNYSKNHDDYINRSPINYINKIKKPILLFHGKKDKVISYEQTLKIQEILIRNNKYSEVMFFENEGHGFKNIENKKVVMQKSQEFLKNALNI
ncbi:Esterase/lipase/thioesterase family active site [Prochlorococcus marinus str. MIT 9302]|uniref:Esterase/lipase/thioesterase family active site n=1 Tax=Prochlorococcus marinus str. MIT 9302 TaxID=74545 RepID=A0A0A2AB72_PROMR|nr:prolyl oligopeptidase family serine peptidase [Prochlorococcus marinus]KGF98840.1 Esterase/lipase/thioesterase family active site [Prochlorococcus marinus str. MIT 9302]